MAVAVFVLGGAASGKTAVIRERYVGTADVYDTDDSRAQPPRGDFSPDRRFDPDAYKATLPTYTLAPGDEQARAKFGSSDLGGPSGPIDLTELGRYPREVQGAIVEIVGDLGFDSLAEFARVVIMDKDEEPVHFGGGLTHELSKFMASAALEGQLQQGPEGGSIVWDATGNTERYCYWIEMALELGFEVDIVYVRCPLPVALMRAEKRARKVNREDVIRTHSKAAKAANELEIMAGEHPASDRITFEQISTSSPGEEAEALEGGYGEV
jgi:hypothetical protein